MTMLSTLVVCTALLLPGTGAAQPSYGEVIEAMAQQAAQLQQPHLMELVSDVSLQYLEGAQWRERHPSDTLCEVARRLRNREREARRSRATQTERKRVARARRRGVGVTGAPVAREVLGFDERLARHHADDRQQLRFEARAELIDLGVSSLPDADQQLLFATEVMGLRYAAAAELLGLDDADQARHRRNHLLARLRRGRADRSPYKACDTRG